ncbi:MAG: ABC transporter ATP-binding protein [Bryobacterales bacterium]|nr:ABC transporter ATP-binding protein [Bryobacterales bacterium]
MSPKPVFRTEGLSKRFPSGGSELVIFENLAFDVYRGERLALVGESGAGKSTLLYLLAGLDRPSAGTIRYLDRELTTLPDTELDAFRNREIGFVWQSHNLLPEFTAIENVMMPLLVRGAARAEAARVASERLDEVGLSERATHRAGELSGGEQQRVSLARALAGDPAVLLSDEPTGNLDFRTGERIFSLLTGLQERRGLTWVLVTHNLSFARRCNRILKLAGGVLAPLSPSDASNEGEGGNGS